MADDKKTISPDVSAPTETPEQPDPAPDLSDTAAPAPAGAGGADRRGTAHFGA